MEDFGNKEFNFLDFENLQTREEMLEYIKNFLILAKRQNPDAQEKDLIYSIAILLNSQIHSGNIRLWGEVFEQIKS